MKDVTLEVKVHALREHGRQAEVNAEKKAIKYRQGIQEKWQTSINYHKFHTF